MVPNWKHYFMFHFFVMKDGHIMFLQFGETTKEKICKHIWKANIVYPFQSYNCAFIFQRSKGGIRNVGWWCCCSLRWCSFCCHKGTLWCVFAKEDWTTWENAVLGFVVAERTPEFVKAERWAVTSFPCWQRCCWRSVCFIHVKKQFTWIVTV